jgi:poly(A) polymerase
MNNSHASPKTPPALPSLADADWFAWPETRALFGVLTGAGVETRAVGGAVRNTLLGCAVGEVDFASTAMPEQVTALAEGAGLKVVPTGIDHGTVTVIIGKRPFEVTTLRRDVETFGRHAKVAYTDVWAIDAGRRDFTMNALYVSSDGALHDPLGGYGDVADRRVRFIGDAGERIREDYLRILRFFRFNAEYGAPPYDADGMAACVRNCAGLQQLSAERVSGELMRLLAAPGAGDALTAMYDYGLLVALLESAPLLADFDRLAALEEAIGATPDPVLRLGSLAVMVPEDARRLGSRFRLSNAETKRLEAVGSYRDLAEISSEKSAKILLYRVGEGGYRDRVLTAWARSGLGPDDAGWMGHLSLPNRWQVPKLPVRGADLIALGYAKGPRLGQALKAIEESWIQGGFTGDRGALLEEAQEILETPKAKAQ